jgi:hypothetical protein
MMMLVPNTFANNGNDNINNNSNNGGGGGGGFDAGFNFAGNNFGLGFDGNNNSGYDYMEDDNNNPFNNIGNTLLNAEMTVFRLNDNNNNDTNNNNNNNNNNNSGKRGRRQITRNQTKRINNNNSGNNINTNSHGNHAAKKKSRREVVALPSKATRLLSFFASSLLSIVAHSLIRCCC